MGDRYTTLMASSEKVLFYLTWVHVVMVSASILVNNKAQSTIPHKISDNQSPASYKYPFLNPDLSWTDRVDDLVNWITIDEAAHQTAIVHRSRPGSPAIKRLGIHPWIWVTDCNHGTYYTPLQKKCNTWFRSHHDPNLGSTIPRGQKVINGLKSRKLPLLTAFCSYWIVTPNWDHGSS